MNFDGGKLQQFVTQKNHAIRTMFSPRKSATKFTAVLGWCPGGAPGGVPRWCAGEVSWGGALGWCPGVVSWNGVLGVSRGVSRGVSWLSWNVVLASCPGWCPRLGLGGVLGWAWGDVLGWCPGVVSWGGVLAGVLGWCPGVVSWGSVPKT